MDIPVDERLTTAELAARIGPRRRGVPTHPKTVWGWMRQGVRGVRLRHVDEVGVLLTTWEWYQAFKAEVAQARAAAKKQDLAAAGAARGPSPRRQAAAEARWKKTRGR